MANTRAAGDSLRRLFEQSGRPIYAVDGARQIVYGNNALAAWLGLESKRVLGRFVEYHSEPEAVDASNDDPVGVLTGLCPPPRALAGEPARGTVSCVARDGRLLHRHANFVPIDVPSLAGSGTQSRRSLATNLGGVLVLLDATDMSPQELAAELNADPTADELHRTIRRFRRAAAAQYSLDSLLGNSSAIRKARAQASAATTSGANLLILGRPGTGRSHLARAVHYRGATDASVKLIPLDCELLTDDLLRRAFDTLRASPGNAKHRSTLLLQNLEHLSPPYQSELLDAMRRNVITARIIGTLDSRHALSAAAWSSEDAGTTTEPKYDDDTADGTRSVPATLDPALFDAISTITIRLPRLVERLEDLPILAQCFLEAANHGRSQQVGSIRADALDLLVLYDWPRELDELREVLAAAHRASKSHEIAPTDLPEVIHHARKAASLLRPPLERVVMEDLLGAIEKQLIERALALAGGNKTEAAALLGITRPRLYRRLVQLGLVAESPADNEMPEFEPQPESS